MVWARRLWLRLQTLFRRERVAQRLDDEVQFHLEQQIAENIAAGMSREEARCAAMRGFGNPTFLKEETRDTRSEEHTSELQSRLHLVCRLLLEKKKRQFIRTDPLPRFLQPSSLSCVLRCVLHKHIVNLLVKGGYPVVRHFSYVRQEYLERRTN